jgi:uncharacterized SAM-binding protein YcdF (DUF218 family)
MMRRRIMRGRVLLVLLAMLIALTCLLGWLLVWPATTPPDRADVVLVLAGGEGERELTGARLARQGVAPVLVVSDGGGPATEQAPGCNLRFDGIRVICLTPRSPTTRGEARAFAELAARERWRSVALVTSRYHIRRASLLIGRCYPGTVYPVGAATVGLRGADLASLRVHEAVGVLAATTVQRGC